MMGGDPGAAGMDPTMAGGDPAAMGDPNAAGADPNAGMGAEDPNAMGGDPEMEDAAGGDDSTEGIISQLSDDDKEAVRNYAKSLLSRDETSGEEMGGNEPMPVPEPPQGQPAPGVMMEITKGRLKKAQKALQERFRENDRKEDESKREQKRVKKNFGKKTPFDSPVD